MMGVDRLDRAHVVVARIAQQHFRDSFEAPGAN
jgi:hypothetical protein